MEALRGDDGPEVLQIRGNASQDGAIERLAHLGCSIGPGAAMHHELSQK